MPNKTVTFDDELYVLVPLEPTDQQLSAYHDTKFGGQHIYEDAGGYFMRCIKAFLTGKRVRNKYDENDYFTYKALLAAAPPAHEKEKA